MRINEEWTAMFFRCHCGRNNWSLSFSFLLFLVFFFFLFNHKYLFSPLLEDYCMGSRYTSGLLLGIIEQNSLLYAFASIVTSFTATSVRSSRLYLRREAHMREKVYHLKIKVFRARSRRYIYYTLWEPYERYHYYFTVQESISIFIPFSLSLSLRYSLSKENVFSRGRST